MKKKVWLALCMGLAAALSASLIFGAYNLWQRKEYAARLREMYDGAVLSALRQMEDMQLSIDKALISSDAGEMGIYLSRVGNGAAQVQRSLSLLPLSHQELGKALKLSNQLSDYAALLIGSGGMTQDQADQLLLLNNACSQCTQALWQAREDLSYRAAAGQQPFYGSDEKTEVYDSQVSYPTLIYDGPFSDEPQAAPPALGNEITREQAHQIALDFVGTDRVAAIGAGADMGGDLPCYGVTVHLHDQLTLEAAVTVKGGKILWMAPDRAEFAQEKSLEECRAAAIAFLESRGYPPMQSTYFQCYQGVMVISFAPVQGDVILYPDLIKVQLRMDTAQVVGWEAGHYLANHHPRGPLSPALSQEEAQGMVSERLKIDGGRLCLIPKNRQEILCFEFQGNFQGHTYLVYINAHTGEQEEILKIVESGAGLETV